VTRLPHLGFEEKAAAAMRRTKTSYSPDSRRHAAGRETQPLERAHAETRLKLPVSMATWVQGHVGALDAS
jgi:hypothetical protein